MAFNLSTDEVRCQFQDRLSTPNKKRTDRDRSGEDLGESIVTDEGGFQQHTDQ